MLEDIYLIIFYVIMVGPSLLVAKETKKRLVDLISGRKALMFLPLTVGGLFLYVIFGMNFLSQIPVLNWSWLGYNIALGPYAAQGAFGILPFIPMLIYMLIHVNYFEEYYFRKTVKMVVIWSFLHLAMGVAVHVALALMPLGFLYKYIYKKYGINYSYSLHFVTNMIIVAVSFGSFFILAT